MDKYVKLQKLIATAGFCSRRKAELLIQQGRVTCNGKIAQIGDKASINCKIAIDNHMLATKPLEKIYLILNKPTGIVSTMHDDHGRKTVAHLIKNKVTTRVFIVGRLDFNSQGLVLLTNDGHLAYKILHPKHNITKKYEVVINRKLNHFEIGKLKNGIVIDGKKTSHANVIILNPSPIHFTLQIEIHEGRKRQIRKMVEAVHAKVVSLTRTQIGTVKLLDLQPGCCRHLNSNEIAKLKAAVIYYN